MFLPTFFYPSVAEACDIYFKFFVIYVKELLLFVKY